MPDLSKTIIPKSDQLNADDLISGDITVTITDVKKMSSPDQPIAIHFQGDNGKPYKPCKSMRRVLVRVWGKDGSTYHGKSMTLFRDDSVKWGGQNVGGIRISHMTDIEKPLTFALTESRSVRKSFTVKPLSVRNEPARQQQHNDSPIDEYARRLGHIIKNEPENAQKFWDETQDQREALQIPDERLLAMDEAVSKAIGA